MPRQDFEKARELFVSALEAMERADFERACLQLEHARNLVPGRASVLHNLAACLVRLKRFEEALLISLEADPSDECSLEAVVTRCSCYEGIGDPKTALLVAEHALARFPRATQAYICQASALERLQQYESAISVVDELLGFEPACADAHELKGIVLRQLRKPGAAVESFVRAESCADEFRPVAIFNRACALMECGFHREAVSAFSVLLDRVPDYPFAFGAMLHAKMLGCDWAGFEGLVGELEERVAAGEQVAEPFGFQALSGSLDNLKLCAMRYAEMRFPSRTKLSCSSMVKSRSKKIRVGYLAGEFRHQATSILMVEVFEKHDKERFEFFLFDNGFDDGSWIRQRINDSGCHLIDVSALSDAEASACISEFEIDILVNLNGYFGMGRNGVFAMRPAAVQVNYLGFPGTLGADYIDYIIADEHVVPRGEEWGYVERIVRLSRCYQANDSRRRVSERVWRRSDAGLPERGFVFCCFNNNYKITPTIFCAWVRILQRVPGSCLWLLQDNDQAMERLKAEAESRGVSSDRLVFAPRLDLEEHLARHALADLFLDTLPYNAHTTASDALWAGVPIVTCRGTTFPGRVASSLLHELGLSELIVTGLDEYEDLAVKLASNPCDMRCLKELLLFARSTSGLFQGEKMARQLELAFFRMHEIAVSGKAPEHINL